MSYKKNVLVIINNASALEQLNFKSNLERFYYLIIGDFSRTKEIKYKSFYYLPLSRLSFKPYSLSSKIQVIFCEVFLLLISIIFLIINKKNTLIFTSVFNTRPLYIIDLIFSNRIKVIDPTYEFIYRYIQLLKNKEKLNFKYGGFRFRRGHELKCKVNFPKGHNSIFEKKLKKDINGPICILFNPNRTIKYWDNIIDQLKNKLISHKNGIIIIMHPKTSKVTIREFEKYLNFNLNQINFEITFLKQLIKRDKSIKISKCITFCSSLDFIFFLKGIPIFTPILLK